MDVHFESSGLRIPEQIRLDLSRRIEGLTTAHDEIVHARVSAHARPSHSTQPIEVRVVLQVRGALLAGDGSGDQLESCVREAFDHVERELRDRRERLRSRRRVAIEPSAS